MNLDEIKEFMAAGGSKDGLSEEEYALLEDAQRLANYAPGEWHENLADTLTDAELAQAATDVWRWVNWDETAREPWLQRAAAGIRMLGVVDEAELPPEGLQFDGMAKVVHPGLMLACMQFWASTFTELFPSEGPVRCVGIGKSNDERVQQTERVQDFMNWQYTTRMPGAYLEKSKLLFELPLMGSMFTKVYYDVEEETAMVIRIQPENFLVPYSCTDLRTSPRYTHRMWVGQHVVKQRQEQGVYSAKSLAFPTESTWPELSRLKEQAQGTQATVFIEDRRHCILECHCVYKFPTLNKLEGAKDDAALPWVVTIDRDSQKVLAVRRNWKQGDLKRKKRVWFIHHGFLPGMGFYNYGFVHAAGGLGRAQTGALRALLDAASMQNNGGGFIAADVRVSLDKPLGSTEWRTVQATSEELARAFFPRPRTEPSDVLLKLLEYFDAGWGKLTSTTDLQVGEGNNNAPVGSTLAIIEQGAKQETAIRHGLHLSHAEEFKILAEMDGEFLPEVYPYAVEGDDKQVYRADFDDRIDVQPVSDPRLATQTQRITQWQAVMQLAQQFPQYYDLREVNRRGLEIMRVPDIDGVLVKDSAAMRQDPISEGMAMMIGKPAKAFPDQDHAAHRLVHRAWFYSLDPQLQQQLGAVYMAHDAEHAAWKFWVQMQQAMGMALPYPAVMDASQDSDEAQEMPPEMENAIAAQAALAVQGMAQQQTQADQAAMVQQQQIQQTQAQAQAEEAARQQALQAQAKEEEFQREQARLDEEARREIERNNLIAQAEREQAAQDSEAERIRQAEENYPEN